MSLVLQKPLCPRCSQVCSQFSKSAKLAWCSKCTNGKAGKFKFFWNPSPEPSTTDLSQEIVHCQARVDFYRLLQIPQEYLKLVNNSLDVIAREQRRLQHLETQYDNAPELEKQALLDLQNAQAQKQALINEQSASTRGPSKSVDSRESLESKLRRKLGVNTYETLKLALGSAEAVQVATILR